MLAFCLTVSFSPQGCGPDAGRSTVLKSCPVNGKRGPCGVATMTWKLSACPPCSPQPSTAGLFQQKRITEILAPLLAVVQQRDTEAQRLQTAGERSEALNKQAADEQKAESKDCSF